MPNLQDATQMRLDLYFALLIAVLGMMWRMMRGNSVGQKLSYLFMAIFNIQYDYHELHTFFEGVSDSRYSVAAILGRCGATA